MVLPFLVDISCIYTSNSAAVYLPCLANTIAKFKTETYVRFIRFICPRPIVLQDLQNFQLLLPFEEFLRTLSSLG